MRLATAATIAAQIRATRPDVTVLAPLFDGSRGYYVPIALASGRRDEVRTLKDAARIGVKKPKPRGRRVTASSADLTSYGIIGDDNSSISEGPGSVGALPTPAPQDSAPWNMNQSTVFSHSFETP